MRWTVAWVAVLGVVACLGVAVAGEAGDEGFVTIFNGKDLEGWDGNPDFWSVKDGVIHGETTKEKPTRGNTFCIWRGGTLADFELRLSFRIQNGNSGVQYRSKDLGKWRIGGYQAEVCNGRSVGFLYGERMRGSLCRVGQKVAIETDEKNKVVKKVVPTRSRHSPSTRRRTGTTTASSLAATTSCTTSTASRPSTAWTTTRRAA